MSQFFGFDTERGSDENIAKTLNPIAIGTQRRQDPIWKHICLNLPNKQGHYEWEMELRYHLELNIRISVVHFWCLLQKGESVNPHSGSRLSLSIWSPTHWEKKQDYIRLFLVGNSALESVHSKFRIAK